MSQTRIPIATTTLTTSAATVTFSSISGSYTDLVLIINGGNTVCNVVGTPNSYMLVRLNGDTGSNYSRIVLAGTGSAANSYRSSNTTSIDTGFYLDNTSTNSIFNFNNYSNTTTYKTALVRGNSSSYEVAAGAYLWRNTAAITSIEFRGTANYPSGSTFTIYGIKAE